MKNCTDDTYLDTPTADQVAERFDERVKPGMPTIVSLRYRRGVPPSILKRLYDRVDTCSDEEIPVLQKVVVGSGMVTEAQLTAYLETFDFALKLSDARSGDSLMKSSHLKMMEEVLLSFKKLGFGSIEGYELKPEQTELLCAHLLAETLNIKSENFISAHDYHMTLEFLRVNIESITGSLLEFIEIARAYSSSKPLHEIMSATNYLAENEGLSLERITTLIKERNGFDREVFDLVVSSASPAVADGTL